MRRKVVKKSKKKNRKRRKVKTYSKKKANGVAIDLQKVVDFKFETLGKIYKILFCITFNDTRNIQ